MELSEKALMELKEAYRKLYSKSKELAISSEQQSHMLDKLIEDIYIERINKLRDEGEIFTDSEKEDVFSQLRILMSKWRKEFDKENTKHTFWELLKRDKQ